MPGAHSPADGRTADLGPREAPCDAAYRNVRAMLGPDWGARPERYPGEFADREITQYRNDAGRLVWGWRCWGGDICEGRIGLDHKTESSARYSLNRHYAEKHTTA